MELVGLSRLASGAPSCSIAEREEFRTYINMQVTQFYVTRDISNTENVRAVGKFCSEA